VWTDDGKVINIDPQPLNRATPEGICLKGLSYVERVNSPERILHPLKKINGDFIQISWEEALTEISEKLDYYKKKLIIQGNLYCQLLNYLSEETMIEIS